MSFPFECPSCEYAFRYKDGLLDHLDDEGHWVECETCTRLFSSQHARWQHMNSLGHWDPRFGCETCSKVFLSSRAAEQHMQNRGHWENYCKSCNNHFDNANNLQMVRPKHPPNSLQS
jgi:uncharacterized C2H2 Zn-finger protein